MLHSAISWGTPYPMARDGHRWRQPMREIAAKYQHASISGAKARDERPEFNQMLKDAVRRPGNVHAIGSVGRLGRSVLVVSNAMGAMRGGQQMSIQALRIRPIS
jgi:hypothetical protein